MKITKGEVINLFNGLHTVLDLPGAKFSYAVARNINILKTETRALAKAERPMDDFLTYEKERIELAKSHAKKDKDGNPVTEEKEAGKSFVVEDMKKFQEDFEKLKEKHKEALDRRKKQLDDFNELLKEESKVDLYTIPEEYIPEGITTAQMTGILPIIRK